MVIKDQSKDPANVVQEIQNLNETISKQNMETMSLKHKVQSLTLNNKTKQNEMDNKLQVMRSSRSDLRSSLTFVRASVEGCIEAVADRTGILEGVLGFS
jgi:predicted PurR-regulated permease PerM